MVLRVLSKVLVLLVVSVVACGCSSRPEITTYEVSGQITHNGQPMPDGSISFEPVPSNNFGVATAEIKNGAYSIRVPAGKQKVRFSLEEMVPSTMEGVNELQPQEVLPAKYNVQSAIVMEVSAEQETTEFNYALTSN